MQIHVVKCVCVRKLAIKAKWIWCSVCHSSQLLKKRYATAAETAPCIIIFHFFVRSNVISFCSRFHLSNRVYSQRMSIHLCMNPKHTIHLSRLDIDRIWHQLYWAANESFSQVPSHNLIKCVDVAWRKEKKNTKKKRPEQKRRLEKKQTKHQIYAGRCSFQNRAASLFR